MERENILKDIKSLIEDIDKCTGDLVTAKAKKYTDGLYAVQIRMEALMIATHQELSFLYDYIDGLWKDAQGDELPEIDHEVVALLDNGKVVFAHRPYQGKYIGKNLISGNIETFENKVYDKGGWNQPNIRFWLDLDLPVEEGDKDE